MSLKIEFGFENQYKAVKALGRATWKDWGFKYLETTLLLVWLIQESFSGLNKMVQDVHFLNSEPLQTTGK